MDRADRHTRLVNSLKIVLPLMALAILSTLFFVSETLDPEAAIPYAEVDVERILRDQGMTQPTFGGVTSDGVTIALVATEVRPAQDNSKILNGHRLNADLDIPGRGTIAIQSPEGIIDTASGEAILQGGAVLESSTGYRIMSERIVTSYLDAAAYTDSEITATGPAGDLTAGAMELTRREGDGKGYLLVFKNGVTLVYEPQP